MFVVHKIVVQHSYANISSGHFSASVRTRARLCVCVCTGERAAVVSAHVHLDVIDFQRCPVTVEPPHSLSWEKERLSKRIPSSALLMFN